MEHLRGWDSTSSNVKEMKGLLRQPKSITSTRLRKYIATVSQTVALTEIDIDWLLHYLGHDVHIHRKFYHLHHSATELAKVRKLLLGDMLVKATLTKSVFIVNTVKWFPLHINLVKK